MPRGSAKDVIEYEEKELGNKIKAEPGLNLDAISSKNLIWVNKTKEQAKEYGEVEPITLDKYRIIARDNYGGLLIEKL